MFYSKDILLIISSVIVHLQVDLNLNVPSKYKLLLKFPTKVQDDSVKATFNKKNGDLKIKIPTVS